MGGSVTQHYDPHMSRSARTVAVLAGLALLAGCAGPVSDAPPTDVSAPPTEVSAPPTEGEYTPAAEDAYDDKGDRPECHARDGDDGTPPIVCEFGDPSSDHVVALVGDSKILQWRPAFEALADERGWRLLQITKSGCVFTDAMIVEDGAAWVGCREWGQAALDLVLTEKPDLVVTSQRRTVAMDGTDPEQTSAAAMVAGLTSYWSQLVEAGISTTVLLDNPGPRSAPDVPTCLLAGGTVDECAFDTADSVAASAAPVQREAASQVSGVEVMDLTESICPDELCVPVKDGILMFRQGTHITATFALSMHPEIADALADQPEAAGPRTSSMRHATLAARRPDVRNPHRGAGS